MRLALILAALCAGCAVDDPTLRTDIDPTLPPGVEPIVEPPTATPIIEPPGAV